MSNIQPPQPSSNVATVAQVLREVQAVKADTAAIRAAVTQDKPSETPVPRYFPRGYFP